MNHNEVIKIVLGKETIQIDFFLKVKFNYVHLKKTLDEFIELELSNSIEQYNAFVAFLIYF